MTMDGLTRMALVVMALLASSVGMAGGAVTTVALRATVRLAPDQAVTLGALAQIEGEQAERLQGLRLDDVSAEPGRWVVVDAERVRGLIEGSGARTGSVVVTGARVNLTRVPVRDSVPVAVTPIVEPGPEVLTLRRQLEAWLRLRYGDGVEEVRLSFDEEDAGMLSTPTDGRVVEVRPIGTSARPALRVTVYEQDSIVLNEAIRFGMQVRVSAPIATRAMRRGERVTEEMFEARTIWTDATDAPAAPAGIVGQVARRAIGAGEVIRWTSLESPVLVRRGEDVSVRTVRGSVVVSTIARARGDASEGELVELESKDRPPRRFTARVSGERRAVMIDPTEEVP